MAVQTQIQVRRGTAASWTSTNPTLAAGEIGFETDTNKFKIGTGSSTWNSLAYANDGDITEVTAGTGISGGGVSGNVVITNSMATAITTKGDLIAGTGSGTFVRQGVGTDGQILIADSAQADGIKWGDNTAPFDIGITVPVGTTKETVSATYTLPAGVYNVQATGAGINTVTYGANSFTTTSAANSLIQNLASPASSISITTNRFWNGTTSTGIPNASSQGLLYTNGFFTVAGVSGTAAVGAWSTTGSSFTALSNIGFYNSNGGLDGFVRNAANTEFAAIGRDFQPINVIATSPNGSTWTTRASVNTQCNKIIAGTGQYVIFGQSNSMMTSPNAITWTSRNAGFTGTDIMSMVFANGLYVAGGGNGTIRTSTDAITWTARTSNWGASSTIQTLVYQNSLYIGVGDTGRMITSTDGTTWTFRSTGTTATIRGAVWDGTLYGIGITGSLRTSPDLATWTTRTGTGYGAFLAQSPTTIVTSIPDGSSGSGAFSTGGLLGATTTAGYIRMNLGTAVTVS
jgi:hypothetical protein